MNFAHNVTDQDICYHWRKIQYNTKQVLEFGRCGMQQELEEEKSPFKNSTNDWTCLIT